MDEVKTCRKCGETKELFDFYKHSGNIYRNTCKECDKERSSRNRISYVPLYTRNIISRLKNLCTKARGRNKNFDLTEFDLLNLWDQQQGLCAYTKLPLLAAANQLNTVSLDRIDSSIGYVVGNIQLVCAAINKMKQEYPEEVFLLFCHSVTQNNKLAESPESLTARYISLGT